MKICFNRLPLNIIQFGYNVTKCIVIKGVDVLLLIFTKYGITIHHSLNFS